MGEFLGKRSASSKYALERSEAAEEEFLKSDDHHYLRKETRHAASRFGRR